MSSDDKKQIKKLAIIAGNGSLPVDLWRYCQKNDIEAFFVCFHGQSVDLPIDQIASDNILWCHLGQLGKVKRFLKSNQIRDAVMIGGIKRPSWSEIRPDITTVWTLLRLSKNIMGDDHILKKTIDHTKTWGVTVRPVQYFLSYLCPSHPGVLTKTKPQKKEWVQIQQSLDTLETISGCDIGQSMVVQDGLVLCVEAIEGTNAMIERAGQVKRSGKGPVLIKIAKKDQELRVDMPTIGMQTMDHVIKNGFSGLVIECGKTLFINKDEVVAKANDAGIFIVVVSKKNNGSVFEA